MTHVYIVRCNFTAPEQEQAWNDWYSGPKIADMLGKPHFVSCQRFRRAAGTGRGYLALWTLASPDAFQTQQYTSDWGFFEWERFITDWSRDLFDGGARPFREFAIERDGTLEVVSFDGMGADDAEAANAAIAESAPDTVWLPIAGLDRHTPVIGLRASAAPASTTPGGANIQRGVYRPICEFQTAPHSA